MSTENPQEKEPIYRAVPESRLIWRNWPEDAARTEAEPLVLAYDTITDYTHLMNPLGAGIVMILQKTPMTVPQLMAKLIEAKLATDDPAHTEEIRRFLNTLVWKGLLEESF